MDKDNLVELANKIYKLTLLFPKKEPLRYRMREAADEILESFVSWEALRDSNPGGFAVTWESRHKDLIFSLNKNLGVLRVYFEIAKWQNWVNYFDVLEIEEEYDIIKRNLEREVEGLAMWKNLKIEFPLQASKVSGDDVHIKVSAGGPDRAEKKDTFLDSLNHRKDRILEFLKEKGQVQVWQVKEVFPEVSKRTLRRDFDKLLKQGIIERIGEKNNTFYQLKKEEA